MATKNRSWDYLAYIAIGLLVVCGAFAYAAYSAKRGVAPSFKNDWTVTLMTAGIAFGYVLRSASLKHDARFWVVWSFFLLLHFSVFLLILSRMNKVPLLLVAAVAPVEFIALTFLLNNLLHRKRSKNRLRQ
jgi:hypothetical protein